MSNTNNESSTYYGEKEDNDTFDTANLLENNVIYEANGSKDDDYDYYKFEMEQAGLADVKVSNFGCTLYSEDEHGNVSQIRSESSRSRIRRSRRINS